MCEEPLVPATCLFNIGHDCTKCTRASSAVNVQGSVTIRLLVSVLCAGTAAITGCALLMIHGCRVCATDGENCVLHAPSS